MLCDMVQYISAIGLDIVVVVVIIIIIILFIITIGWVELFIILENYISIHNKIKLTNYFSIIIYENFRFKY